MRTAAKMKITNIIVGLCIALRIQNHGAISKKKRPSGGDGRLKCYLVARKKS